MINVTPDITWSGNDVFQSTSFNIPRPTGANVPVVGMLMVLALTFADTQTNTSSVSIAGWTLLGPPSGQVIPDKYFFYRIANSSDTGGGNWVCTCQDGFTEVWVGMGWNGVDNVTPFAVGPSYVTNTGTSLSWTSLTSPGTGSVWGGMLCIENNTGTYTPPTAPPTEQVSLQDPYNQTQSAGFSTGVNSGSGPTVAGTVVTNAECTSAAFFLNPASGGGNTASIAWVT